MGIASFPSILLVLILAALSVPFDRGGVAVASTELAPRVAGVQTEDGRSDAAPWLAREASFGRGWLQLQARLVAAVDGRAMAALPLLPALTIHAELRTLGMRAGFAHDAAGSALSFAFERLPDLGLPDLDLPDLGLRDLLRP